jgi:hypothetical protein
LWVHTFLFQLPTAIPGLEVTGTAHKTSHSSRATGCRIAAHAAAATAATAAARQSTGYHHTQADTAGTSAAAAARSRVGTAAARG